MTYPLIGHDNLLERGAVTSTDAAAGYTKENAYDWLQYDWWKPASTGTKYLTVDLGVGVTSACDYLAIASHTLGTTGSTVTLQYSADNGATWNDCHTTHAPTTDKPFLIKFTERTVGDYRLKVVTGATVPVLGVVAFGKALEVPSFLGPGFRPLHLGMEHENVDSIGRTGLFLGRSTREMGSSASLPFDMLDQDWVRANWEPFLAHAKEKPFFFAWDIDGHPSEVALCWTTAKDLNGPKYTASRYMSVSLDVRGSTA